MPIDYKNYPKDWKQIRTNILSRARNRCEQCGLPNHMWGSRDEFGEFLPATETEKADRVDCLGKKVFRVVLTIAHLNHDITDNRPENLKALCQKCHLTLDTAQHRTSRWKNRYKDTPDLSLKEI